MLDIFQNKKAIIFDLDGTLVDSMWIWDTIIEEYLDGFCISNGPKLKEFINYMHISKVAEYINDRYELRKSGAQVMVDWNKHVIEQHRNRVEIIPGAKDFLDYVKAAGIRLCVATESGGEVVEIALKEKGLFEYFEFLICADDVGVGKTSNKIFTESANRLGASPKETIVFEDALYAIKTAVAAGFEVVGVDEKYQRHNSAEIKKLTKIFIRDYHELL